MSVSGVGTIIHIVPKMCIDSPVHQNICVRSDISMSVYGVGDLTLVIDSLQTMLFCSWTSV